jgi:5-methylcytosine-specific restriction endonuclease McrA
VLLKDLARKKFAATERPRASRGTAPGSRDIAAKVRRVVWPRDQGTCTFVGKGGRRCNERAFIEFDHIHPHGARGEGTTENIRLLCRLCCARHKRHYAECRIMPTAVLRLSTMMLASVRDSA